MTIAEYERLTGTVVSDADKPKMQAIIRRAESKLESLLGYSLSKQNKWTELGKVRFNGMYPYLTLPLIGDTTVDLDEPSEQYGNIQLFNFDELDTHIRINPAKEVHRVSVVKPVNRDEFVTVYDLPHATPYLNEARLIVAITRQPEWYSWSWWPTLTWTERSDLMLAVDADYVNVCDANKYPDLAYLLTDMITYYADPQYSLMGNIRSESIDSHSYSRASTGSTPDSAAPEGQVSAKRTIEKYAGPAAFRKMVR